MTGIRLEIDWPGEAPAMGSAFSAAERASLGRFIVHLNGRLATCAQDADGKLHDGPVVPTVKLAEWLLWNWWRLRWEPARFAAPLAERSINWHQAHEMMAIGEGWMWPDLGIASDGYRVSVRARASEPISTEPLVFLTDVGGVLTATEFEWQVDRLVQAVIDHLPARSDDRRALVRTRNQLAAERTDADHARYRKVEALLGNDPDEADAEMVETIIADGRVLGERAMQELAADRYLEPARLREMATKEGFDARPDDGISVPGHAPVDASGQAPWQAGVARARELRELEGLGTRPISTPRLATLYGVDQRVLRSDSGDRPIAFALGRNIGNGAHAADAGGERVVLRARHPAGRRFELARLLGDRLLEPADEPLRPATRWASTYRQKAQRAFAAEFLCPIDGLTEMLEGDYATESIEYAASRFRVSPLLATNQLANNGLIDVMWADDPDISPSALAT